MSETDFIQYFGVTLFVLFPMLCRQNFRLLKSLYFNKPRQLQQLKQISANRTFTNKDVNKIILKMEQIIQRDEGKRGIKEILLPPGELFHSAEEMMKASKVVIVTGFPCLLDRPVHTETDGPLGAVSIAKTLLLMGKSVTILTDECNEEVLLSCVAGANLHKFNKKLQLESFPPLSQCTERDYSRMSHFHATSDLFIAIERAGPNFEGYSRTMRNRDMSHLVAPLEGILLSGDGGEIEGDDVIRFSESNLNSPYIYSNSPVCGQGESTTSSGDISTMITSSGTTTSTPLKSVFRFDSDDVVLSTPNNATRPNINNNTQAAAPHKLKPMRSIGIGDGGNEVGMGKVYHKILASRGIANAREIACIVPTDHLIVASVSNWGGYALSAAAAVLFVTGRRVVSDVPSSSSSTSSSQLYSVISDEITHTISSFLPTDEEEWSKIQRMVEAGAGDGMTGRNECLVDGMPFEESLRVLGELRRIMNEGEK